MALLRAAGLATLCIGLAMPAAAQTFKVKAPKGDASGLGFALNPENDDLLVVFEVDGEIYATIAKNKNGKRKARKAKSISGDTEAHRPYAAYRPDAREYLVAWDTAPGDLSALAESRAARGAAGSEILLQRLKRTNAKPLGASLRRGEPERLNVSPHFFSSGDPDEGDFGMLWVETDEGAGRAAARTQNGLKGYDSTVHLLDDVQTFFLPTEVERYVQLTAVKRVGPGGELVLGMDAIRSGNLTNALLYGRNPGANSLAGPFNTPSVFPNVHTTDAGYTMASDMSHGVGTYNEGGRGWVERHQPTTWAPMNGTPVGGFGNSARVITHPVSDNGFATYAGRVPRTDVAYIAGQQQDGTVRLFRVSDAGIDDGQVLFTTARTIEQMRLVLVPGSNLAVLLWIEVVNASTDEVKGHVFAIE